MVGSGESNTGKAIALVIGGILLAADAFGLDLAWSPDLAIGVPYALVVVLGLWWPDRNYILTAAVVGSLLCLLGFYYSFPNDPLWMAVVNRGFAIFIIWMVTVLCLFHKKVKIKAIELQRLNDHIGQICSEAMTRGDEGALFQKILDTLLSFTQSRCGIIYAVIQNQKGKSCLEKKAGLTWSTQFEKPKILPSMTSTPISGEEVYSFSPLLDEVLHSGKPLLMKYVSQDLRAGTLSSSYPPIESFMGLPFYFEGSLLAVVGVANQAEGYDESRVKYIVPFLSSCAIRIHDFKIGQECVEMKNVLSESRGRVQALENESRGKIKAMENDTALLRLKVLEKEALLDQVEEQFSKVNNNLKEQESRLLALAEGRDKDEEKFNRLQENLNRLQEEKGKSEGLLREQNAQIEKAEEDRNRTAGALWEKEQRLADVLDDRNQMKKDLQEKMESLAKKDEELEQIEGQRYERDDRLASMEIRCNKTQEDLEKKDKLLERLEFKMLEVETQVQQMKIALRDREGLLEKIEMLIHASLKGNPKAGSPKEFERTPLKPKEKQNMQMEQGFASQPQDHQKTYDRQRERVAPDRDFEQKKEEQNGKNQPLDREPDKERVKNRFRQYTRELERSNQDLSEFASIASHDLQEPLRKILSFGMLLKKDCSPHLDDRGKDYLRRMERSAKQMQNFVVDLLQYSKLASASTLSHSVDLKEVISHVLTILEAHIEETHPIIEAGPLPVLEADRMQMVQLFQNLISNALKFHKKGESPVIKISHRLLENGFHEIRVKDQGIGIDKSHLGRVFKPFERLHGRSDYEGTGMGLAICQKIVLRHGGKLIAESSPEEGATFIVTLPIRHVNEKKLSQ